MYPDDVDISVGEDLGVNAMVGNVHHDGIIFGMTDGRAQLNMTAAELSTCKHGHGWNRTVGCRFLPLLCFAIQVNGKAIGVWGLHLIVICKSFSCVLVVYFNTTSDRRLCAGKEKNYRVRNCG